MNMNPIASIAHVEGSGTALLAVKLPLSRISSPAPPAKNATDSHNLFMDLSTRQWCGRHRSAAAAGMLTGLSTAGRLSLSE